LIGLLFLASKAAKSAQRTENLNNRVSMFVKQLLDKPIIVPKVNTKAYDYREGSSPDHGCDDSIFGKKNLTIMIKGEDHDSYSQLAFD